MNIEKPNTFLSTLFCVILYLFSSEITSANDDTCTSDSQLINTSQTDLQSVLPCSTLGSLYIVGLGVENILEPVLTLRDRGSVHPFPFYSSVRIYLAQRGSAPPMDTAVERYSALLNMLSRILTQETIVSDRRINTYVTFALSEYWSELMPQQSDTDGFLDDAIRGIGPSTGFSSLEEIGCFVYADLPSLSMDEIIRSLNYLECMDEDGSLQ